MAVNPDILSLLSSIQGGDYAKGAQFSSMQEQAANRLLSDPNYVMTPDDWTLIKAQPYSGQDLFSESRGMQQANQQSIASNNFMGTYGGLIPIAAFAAPALASAAFGGAAGAAGAGGVADIGVGGAAANSVGAGLAGSAGAGSTVGGGMWDWLTNLLGGATDAPWGVNSQIGGTGAFDMGGSAGVFDTMGNPLYSSPASIGALTPGVGDAGAFDQFGSIASPNGSGVGGTIFDPAAQQLIQGGSGFSLPPGLSEISKLLFGDKGLSGILGDRGLLGVAGSTVPGMLALNYAKSQPNIDTSQLQSVYSQAGANTPGFVQAAIDPFQQNIAAGYGDLLQSQAQRGIRGSSFGDSDIANYLSTTGRALSGAGSTAQQQALGLQGNLAGQIASLNAQNQQIKNQLYGRAFDVFGRGLSPSPYAWIGSTGP